MTLLRIFFTFDQSQFCQIYTNGLAWVGSMVTTGQGCSAVVKTNKNRRASLGYKLLLLSVFHIQVYALGNMSESKRFSMLPH